jgi:hypothetical protein
MYGNIAKELSFMKLSKTLGTAVLMRMLQEKSLCSF